MKGFFRIKNEKSTLCRLCLRRFSFHRRSGRVCPVLDCHTRILLDEQLCGLVWTTLFYCFSLSNPFSPVCSVQTLRSRTCYVDSISSAGLLAFVQSNQHKPVQCPHLGCISIRWNRCRGRKCCIPSQEHEHLCSMAWEVFPNRRKALLLLASSSVLCWS
jgi:hypothetical protein